MKYSFSYLLKLSWLHEPNCHPHLSMLASDSQTNVAKLRASPNMLWLRLHMPEFVEISINLQVLRKIYRCTNFTVNCEPAIAFFLMEQEIFLTFKSTLRVRSLQIYICTPQCHFLSWTCSLSVTNSITGNSWHNPVKTVTHKKVLLELEFSPWPWGSTFHAKLIMRDAKNNLSQ